MTYAIARADAARLPLPDQSVDLVIGSPPSIAALPTDPVRKVPVPWFVAWIDGKPEFRVADSSKLRIAIRDRKCWVCGQRLDNRATYVIGPVYTWLMASEVLGCGVMIRLRDLSTTSPWLDHC
jgi:hypothetical protein